MSFPRFLAAGLFVSVFLHGAGSAYFAQDGNEVSMAAGKGGGVSVIGSIEDLVLGTQADMVEVEEPIDEVEPVTEPVQEVREPVELEEVEPPLTAESVQPVRTVSEPVPVAVPVAEAVAMPVVSGVTSTDPVTAEEPLEEVTPEETRPLTAKVEPVTEPIEIARLEQPDITEPQQPVKPDTEILEPLPEVERTPVAKPKPPVEKTEKVKKVKKKKKAVQRNTQRGADRNSQRGGERITSRTARSNANGRADSKENDQGAAATSNYQGKVRAKVMRAQRYPRAANRKSIVGTVFITFTVAKNGSVSGVRINRSSGSSILDKATIDMIHRAAPLPKIPDNMRKTKMRFTIPIEYRKNRRR